MIEAFGRTDVGRRRKANEDSFLVAPDSHLYAVCDGMGGHNAGEVASQMAIESLAAGKPIRGRSSQSMTQPVLKAAGFMHDTLRDAGPGAYAEVAMAAPPMVMLSLGAKLFPFVSKQRRGRAMMLAMSLVAAATAAVTWLVAKSAYGEVPPSDTARPRQAAASDGPARSVADPR